VYGSEESAEQLGGWAGGNGGGDGYDAGNGIDIASDVISVSLDAGGSGLGFSASTPGQLHLVLDGSAGDELGQSGLTLSDLGVQLTRAYTGDGNPHITYVADFCCTTDAWHRVYATQDEATCLGLYSAQYGSLVTAVCKKTFTLTLTLDNDGRVGTWSDAA
jgi:hypothetical protein